MAEKKTFPTLTVCRPFAEPVVNQPYHDVDPDDDHDIEATEKEGEAVPERITYPMKP